MNEIICGDCVDVMESIPSGSAGLIVTSPPFNMHAGNTGWGRGHHRNKKFTNYDVHDDSMPEDEYVSWQRKCLDSMMRVLDDSGAIFYNQKWRIANQLRSNTCDKIMEGFPVRQIIIWAKYGGINHDDRWFLPTYEVIYVIAKPGFSLLPKANAVGDVWQIGPERKIKNHPAPFPLEIPLRAIRSTKARTILDPFCGSGTTCLAAKLLDRSYIGIDISKKYCQIARQRVGQEPLS